MSTDKSFPLFLISLLLMMTLGAGAQTSTSSPYSIYGLGRLEPRGFASTLAMGDAKYAVFAPYSINNANPASYGSLAPKTPVFEVGIASNFTTFSTETASQSTNNTYLKNIAFGIPVAKWWGLGFGLVPFSNMGYTITAQENVENFGQVDYLYEGSGGINQFYIGNAFNLIRDTTQQLSLGFNGSYLFGILDKTRRVMPEGSTGAFNTRITNVTNVADFYFELGAYYKRKVTEKFKFAFGATYTYSIDNRLKASQEIFAISYTGSSTSETVKDTVMNIPRQTGNVYLPSNIGAGMALHIGENEKWTIAADYSTQNWSDFSIFDENAGLAESNQLSIGLQLVPDRTAFTKIFKTMNYRLGGRYSNTFLNINGQQISEYGISFGLGIPMIKSQSRTNLNLAVEFGERGKVSGNLIKEQFVNLTVGFSLAPHKFDRWFYKRKIE